MKSGAQPGDWRERDWEHEALWAEHDRLKIEGAPIGDVLGRICDLAWEDAERTGAIEGLEGLDGSSPPDGRQS